MQSTMDWGNCLFRPLLGEALKWTFVGKKHYNASCRCVQSGAHVKFGMHCGTWHESVLWNGQLFLWRKKWFFVSSLGKNRGFLQVIVFLEGPNVYKCLRAVELCQEYGYSGKIIEILSLFFQRNFRIWNQNLNHCALWDESVESQLKAKTVVKWNIRCCCFLFALIYQIASSKGEWTKHASITSLLTGQWSSSY